HRGPGALHGRHDHDPDRLDTPIVEPDEDGQARLSTVVRHVVHEPESATAARRSAGGNAPFGRLLEGLATAATAARRRPSSILTHLAVGLRTRTRVQPVVIGKR